MVACFGWVDGDVIGVGFRRRLCIVRCYGLCMFGICFPISCTPKVGVGSKFGLFCRG